MKTAIRYFTRSGNTKKLADAIAGAVGVPALTVAEPLREPVDTLFLGCSYYAFDVDGAVKDFVAQNRANIGRIVRWKRKISTAAAPLARPTRGVPTRRTANGARPLP